MTLKEYLERPDALSPAQLAFRLNVTRGRISQIKGGDKCSARLALMIEATTDGLVDAGDLAPIIKDARNFAPHKGEII